MVADVKVLQFIDFGYLSWGKVDQLIHGKAKEWRNMT
jgi:hypothetical protein